MQFSRCSHFQRCNYEELFRRTFFYRTHTYTLENCREQQVESCFSSGNASWVENPLKKLNNKKAGLKIVWVVSFVLARTEAGALASVCAKLVFINLDLQALEKNGEIWVCSCCSWCWIFRVFVFVLVGWGISGARTQNRKVSRNRKKSRRKLIQFDSDARGLF